MEIVLLWLDDLDDLVFVAAAFWTRLRRFCLQIGLFAALLLAGSELSTEMSTAQSIAQSTLAADWSLAFAGIAGASVVVWTAGALLVLLAGRMDLNRALI